VSHFTTRGCAWAADPTAPDLDLPAFAPSKLYYTAMPRSFLEKLPAFQQRRADIRGQKLGFVGVPDEAITTAIEVNALLRAKLQALSCHRTQFDFDPETNLPKSFWTAVPEPQRSQFFGYERFVLTYSTVGQSEGLESDLFARL
jgi:LmbE family N-acetylglucosaminyl deacetylase